MDPRDEKDIADILSEFDFQKVQAAMEALGWVWFVSNMEVPDVVDIRETGERLLRDVAQNPSIAAKGTGGLCARRRGDGALSLTFVVAEADGDERPTQ